MDFDKRTFGNAVLVFWVVVLTILFFVLCLPANSDIEIGTGYSIGIPQADGSGYYQHNLPHWTDLDDNPISVGISWRPTDTRYRVEYLYLGQQNIKATIVDDQNYTPQYLSTCSPCGQYTVAANGAIAGIVLSASHDIFDSPAYFEAGIYVNRKTWRAKLHRLTDGSLLAEAQREPAVDIGPVIGIGWRKGGLDFGVRYIYLDDSGEGDPMTPAVTGGYTVMLKGYF